MHRDHANELKLRWTLLSRKGIGRPRADRIYRDALQRPEGTHSAIPSLLQQGRRACTICTTAKARCSGDSQCTRCQERGVQCVYPVRAEASAPSAGQKPASTYLPATQQYEQQYQTQGEHASMPELMPYNAPSMIGTPGTLDDFELMWDQNILSSTNWLEVLDPSESEQYNFVGLPAYGGPAEIHPRFFQGSSRSQGHTDSPGSVISTHPIAVADIATSQGFHGESLARPGEYYVDGEPARLPRVKRRKTSVSRRSVTVAGSHDLSLKLPDGLRSIGESCSIEDFVYLEIQGLYRRNCIEPPTLLPPYELVEFPAKEMLEHLLGLYFKYFD